jgi:hypothetical protein
LHASDGYSSDITLADAANASVLVAFKRDGQALAEHLRLVIPGK